MLETRLFLVISAHSSLVSVARFRPGKRLSRTTVTFDRSPSFLSLLQLQGRNLPRRLGFSPLPVNLEDTNSQARHVFVFDSQAGPFASSAGLLDRVTLESLRAPGVPGIPCLPPTARGYVTATRAGVASEGAQSSRCLGDEVLAWMRRGSVVPPKVIAAYSAG